MIHLFCFRIENFAIAALQVLYSNVVFKSIRTKVTKDMIGG